MKQKKISLFQYSALLITFLLGTIIIICPEVIISDQLGWLTDITAIALSFISILLLIVLHQPLFDSNIVEIANQVGGAWFRIIIGTIYTIYALHLGAVNYSALKYRASWSPAFMGVTRNIKQVTQSACPTPILLSS